MKNRLEIPVSNYLADLNNNFKISFSAMSAGFKSPRLSGQRRLKEKVSGHDLLESGAVKLDFDGWLSKDGAGGSLSLSLSLSLGLGLGLGLGV
jgi:hypothetical protein